MYSLDTLQRLNDAAVAKYLAQTESGERTCDYCNEAATHSIPVYNPADSVREVEGAYSLIHVCEEHHDNGSFMEELFYCDGCGELFVTHHSGDVLYVERDGEMLCQKCALERMEPVALLDLVNDLERGDVSKWLRANDFPGKQLLWEGEFSEWSDFPGHTDLKSVAKEILQAAYENGLGEDSEVYPLVTHGYQFSLALGVYF